MRPGGRFDLALGATPGDAAVDHHVSLAAPPFPSVRVTSMTALGIRDGWEW
jgi:hypothetical protein